MVFDKENTGPGNGWDFKKNMADRDELSAVLDMSAAGIARLKDRKILWTNATLCQMLGYDASEILGKDTRLFYLNDEEYDRVGAQLYKGVQHFGQGFAETRLKRKDDNTLDCRIRASLLDQSAPHRGEVVVITDISELKLLQIQLQQAQKMEAIGVLAGGISHDFNNILMAIQGHLSLMQINPADAESTAKHIRHMAKLVKVAAELTSRLLGFARGGKYRLEIIDMNELTDGCLKKYLSTRKDLSVTEIYAPDLDLVDADAGQLRQVMLNLFINAAQAMTDNQEQGKPEKELTVETSNLLVDDTHRYPFDVRPGRYVRVSVTDNGIGMDEKIQKKVFDPFFTTKQAGNEKGTGLGLSTVFGIIKNHSGYITLDSIPGKGSSFHIHLPVRKTAA